MTADNFTDEGWALAEEQERKLTIGKFLYRLFDRTLDPRSICRLWSVHLLGWSHGRFKCFWFKRNALRYAKKYWEEAPFIDLEHEITGEWIRLKDNPNGTQ